MEVVDLFGEEWDGTSERPGRHFRTLVVGRRLGGELLGASVYEIDPGEATYPYHWHHGNEELLLVVSGRPLLRSPEGERELATGDAVLFPRGPEGAHSLRNDGEEPARFLIVSTLLAPEVCEYPDSDKVAVWSRHGTIAVPRAARVDYWEGEA